ncbi:MAG: orotidine-5'-phosphate decarboxylase [Bacteroidales bacterium]|nr:orotidine-5'-phosphate decarboxylase [Bacteroidales bacterium]
MTANQLYGQIKEKQSCLCVGLDPDLDRLPAALDGEKYPLFIFNREIIDATAQFAVCYKPNTAFYECYGAWGWEQLEMTVGYIKEQYPEMMVIADAKRGDIGNTAGHYAKAFFENMPCDAVTLAPYMGRDSVEPFLAYKDKWAVVLGLTSNASAADFEMQDDLYKKVISTAMQWGTPDNMMFVAGATRPQMLADIRAICPDHFLLVPGVGAQGGSVEQVAKYGANSRCGLLINSSRGIIYASSGSDFADAAAAAAASLKSQMEEKIIAR